GRFGARCGLLSLDGWRKDDPDSILGLDTYRLVLTENGRALVGPTRSHGDWEGRFEATRAGAAARPPRLRGPRRRRRAPPRRGARRAAPTARARAAPRRRAPPRSAAGRRRAAPR